MMLSRFDRKSWKKRYLFMAEPKVSHKHLEEPTPCFEARKQHLVVSVLLTLLFVMASVDEISATSPTVDHQDGLIRIQRDPAMPNDRSMSAADISDKDDSSTHSSLPLSVEVADDDNEEIGLLSSCSADEYLDTLSNTCQKCTACGPGTQHESDEDCGYGQGSEQSCEPCPPNHYQDKTSTIPVECKLCITCDEDANTTRECSPEHNAECGPCQPGFYYFQENNCVSCKQDRTREECRMTTPITPDPTESTSVPPPVVSTTAQTVTISEGPKGNTTDPTVHVPCSVPALTRGLVVTGCTAEGVAAQGNTCIYSCTNGSLSGQSMVTCGSDGIFSPPIPTCDGGVDQPVLTGVIVIGAIVGMLVIAFLIGLVWILKKKYGESDTRVENGATGGLPGSQNVLTVRYNRAGETIQYDGICQVDENDEPHSLRSNLSVGPSTVSPSSGYGPAVLAPPDGLPREDALPLSGDMAALPAPTIEVV